VVDVVGILSDSNDPRNYWKVMKNRLNNEGSEVVTNCNQLRLISKDGKKRETDVADVESMLRIIQSIPSPKAEPFKVWLAKVGYERLQETIDQAEGFNKNAHAAKKGGTIAGHARKQLDKQTGKTVISPKNYLSSTKLKAIKKGSLKKKLNRISSSLTHMFQRLQTWG